jgi:hypothetical protein
VDKDWNVKVGAWMQVNAAVVAVVSGALPCALVASVFSCSLVGQGRLSGQFLYF